MLAMQCGAMATSGCTEKIPCLWVQQNIHIVIIVLYYNSGCQEPLQQAQCQAGVQWNRRETACYETLYGAKSV